MFVRVGLGSFACVLSSALDLRPACLILLMCLCLCQVGALGGGSGLAPPGASWHWTTLQTQEPRSLHWRMVWGTKSRGRRGVVASGPLDNTSRVQTAPCFCLHLSVSVAEGPGPCRHGSVQCQSLHCFWLNDNSPTVCGAGRRAEGTRAGGAAPLWLHPDVLVPFGSSPPPPTPLGTPWVCSVRGHLPAEPPLCEGLTQVRCSPGTPCSPGAFSYEVTGGPSLLSSRYCVLRGGGGCELHDTLDSR